MQALCGQGPVIVHCLYFRSITLAVYENHIESFAGQVLGLLQQLHHVLGLDQGLLHPVLDVGVGSRLYGRVLPVLGLDARILHCFAIKGPRLVDLAA